MSTLAQSMQQFPWQKLVLLFIVVGFSVLSWVFKQLQQQRELRRQEMQRQRVEQESLRTGRPSARAVPDFERSEEPVSEQAKSAAARRAAQLEELRRRKQARAGGKPAGTPRLPKKISAGSPSGQGIDINLGGVILRIPGSSGPTVPGTRSPKQGNKSGGSQRRLTPEQAADLRRREAQQKGFETKRGRGQGPAPRGAQADQRETARLQAQEQQRRAQARRAEQSRYSEEGVSGEDPVRRLVRSDPDAPPPAPKAALRHLLSSLRGPGLRDAMILREVLGPPIAMRNEPPAGPGARV